MRVFLWNTIAVLLGLLSGFGLISLHSSKSLAKQPVSKVIDVYNVDYNLPSSESEEFKNNPILSYTKPGNMNMKSFDVKAARSHTPDAADNDKNGSDKAEDIDQKLEKYYHQDAIAKRAEEAAFEAIERNKPAAYQAYIQQRAALKQEVEKEISEKLKSYFISSEDVKLTTLEE